MSIGNQIKRLREKNNMNQEQFAKYIGVSASTIGMYEQGRRKPKYEILEAIADIFNIPMSYLFEDDNRQVADNSKILDCKENELLKYFNKLNDVGKDKALEYISDLTNMTKYTEKLYKIAARNGKFEEKPLSDSEIEELLNCPDVDDL